MGLGTPSESARPRQSLYSAVANRLHDQVIRGEIAEGTQLLQDAIATEYQVSKILNLSQLSHCDGPVSARRDGRM